MFGAAMVAAGLAISTLGSPAALYVGHGVFIGLLGNACINAPLYVYVARWFDRRRGSAVALISSGQYLAGTVWPVLFSRGIEVLGWRGMMLGYAVLVVVILPTALAVFRPPPEAAAAGPAAGLAGGGAVLGMRPNLVMGLLCAAGLMCCVPMAMPQGHLVAFCTDVGIAPAHGAAML